MQPTSMEKTGGHKQEHSGVHATQKKEELDVK